MSHPFPSPRLRDHFGRADRKIGKVRAQREPLQNSALWALHGYPTHGASDCSCLRRPTQYLASQHFCMHQKSSPSLGEELLQLKAAGKGRVRLQKIFARLLVMRDFLLSESTYPISPGARAVCTKASACASSALPRSCITNHF